MTVDDRAGLQAVFRPTVGALCFAGVSDVKENARMHAPQRRFRPRTVHREVFRAEFDDFVRSLGSSSHVTFLKKRKTIKIGERFNAFQGAGRAGLAIRKGERGCHGRPVETNTVLRRRAFLLSVARIVSSDRVTIPFSFVPGWDAGARDSGGPGCCAGTSPHTFPASHMTLYRQGPGRGR